MAAPTDNQVLEKVVGGLPIVQYQGLNTNKAVNFSGLQVDTSGNLSIPSGTTIAGSATGPTGSFANVNLQQTIIAGSSASVAIIGTAGASGGGPATSQMQGWAVIYISGVKSFIPIWQ